MIPYFPQCSTGFILGGLHLLDPLGGQAMGSFVMMGYLNTYNRLPWTPDREPWKPKTSRPRRSMAAQYCCGNRRIGNLATSSSCKILAANTRAAPTRKAPAPTGSKGSRALPKFTRTCRIPTRRRDQMTCRAS